MISHIWYVEKCIRPSDTVTQVEAVVKGILKTEDDVSEIVTSLYDESRDTYLIDGFKSIIRQNWVVVMDNDISTMKAYKLNDLKKLLSTLIPVSQYDEKIEYIFGIREVSFIGLTINEVIASSSRIDFLGRFVSGEIPSNPKIF